MHPFINTCLKLAIVETVGAQPLPSTLNIDELVGEYRAFEGDEWGRIRSACMPSRVETIRAAMKCFTELEGVLRMSVIPHQTQVHFTASDHTRHINLIAHLSFIFTR